MKSAHRAPQRIALLAVLCLPLIAEAHPGHAGLALRDGFAHPWLGLDHLLAMLAVGLWARQMRRAPSDSGERSSLLILPALFIAAVAAGAIAGQKIGGSGMVETLIATSLIALGALLAAARRVSRAAAIALLVPMGLVHGWAHGAEMPADAPMLPFFAGFLSATALLHLCGIGVASLALNRGAAGVLRAGGVGLAAVGCGLLAVI
ncbi:MAG: HupE/UreJ family protein [Pseudomonadota bacterium]|nr:HupE/UreJ family protein [Pseudomonadota bacterium]